MFLAVWPRGDEPPGRFPSFWTVLRDAFAADRCRWSELNSRKLPLQNETDAQRLQAV
jgi:hypothetical protein